MKLGIRNKKEVPPEKKVERARIILVALAVIFLIVVLHPPGKKAEGPKVSETEAAMEATLDSLIRDMGFESYTVYYKGPIETVKQNLDCPEEDEIIRLELRRDLLEKNPGLTDKEKIAQIENIMQEIDVLKTKVERFYANPNSKMVYESRRIRFSTTENRKYTFFQQMMKGMFRTRYLIEITDIGENPDEELEILKNQNFEE